MDEWSRYRQLSFDLVEEDCRAFIPLTNEVTGESNYLMVVVWAVRPPMYSEDSTLVILDSQYDFSTTIDLMPM
jgi:hypothetical protein